MKNIRVRGRYWSIGVVPALVLCLVTSGRAHGQVTATPQKDLAFGMLTPGIPSTVTIDDTIRRAEWVLTGPGTVTISFVLPAGLVGPNLEVLPLSFAAGDAAWQRGGMVQVVDPNTPFSVTVRGGQTIYVLLGGTAQPTTTQGAGTYSATVTMIMAAL